MIPNRITKKMDLLFDLAQEIQGAAGTRVAAMILYGHETIGIGVNSMRSCPMQMRLGNNPKAMFQHAEVAALKSARYQVSTEALERSKILVCRVKQNFDGDFIFGLAKPCLSCMQAIVEYQLSDVYYTTDEQTIAHMRIPRMP